MSSSGSTLDHHRGSARAQIRRNAGVSRWSVHGLWHPEHEYDDTSHPSEDLKDSEDNLRSKCKTRPRESHASNDLLRINSELGGRNEPRNSIP